jgi:thiamine-monophosphate kinase
MSLTEFELIEKYFSSHKNARSDVIVSIGDDAAIVHVPPEKELVVSTDTLIEGVHFPIETSPEDIGYKALAVNLSDFSAMGAEPAWLTLALTLPRADDEWLKRFSQGLFELIEKYSLQLIGGDTTRGPLSITIQLMGFVSPGRALRREGAMPGDIIYVTGTLGDAGLALLDKNQPMNLNATQRIELNNRLQRPTPRLEIAKQLQGFASSAIDLSDGLGGDLQHILNRSHVGATVYVEKLPRSKTLLELVSTHESIRLALSAGDDYELCFTAPEKASEEILAISKHCSVNCVAIGNIEQEPGLRWINADGKPYILTSQSYQHFST